MTRPCAPACEPDDNGHCQLAEDITKLTGQPITASCAAVQAVTKALAAKTMLDSILATSPPEPRARGVVPPTEPLQGPQEAAQRLTARVYDRVHPTILDHLDQLTAAAADRVTRGGYIPPPGYGLPTAMPWPDKASDADPDREDPQ